MSRLTGDRNSQQQQQQQAQQHHSNQLNQQIVQQQQQSIQQLQTVRQSSTTVNQGQPQQQLLQQQQQQILALQPSGSYIIINNNSNTGTTSSIDVAGHNRTPPTNLVNPVHHQSSIFYSTPPPSSTVTSATTTITSTTNSSSSSSNQNSNVSSTTPAIQSTLATHSIDPTSPIAKKRLKLEVADSSSSCSSTNTTEDLSALKKRILEHKLQRLKSLKEKQTEHVAELFFLQSSGNMMEYPTWRKKIPTPQFISFKKLYRLDQTVPDDADSFRTLNQQSLPEGAEIKIPGVGITPIAVSTQLPAAVAQLSQKGQIPGKPQGGRHGMVFGQITSSSNTIGNSPQKALVPGGTPIIPDPKRLLSGGSIIIGSTNGASTSTGLNGSALTPVYNSNDQFSVKAKEEVYVLQRVNELKREGLWMGARLPKLAEPQRHKVHWDFLLEEMQWLAADFANERKWKKAAAKRCARMVQKHFQDKEMAAQKAEKAQEQNLKRIAAFIAKEIKTFWANVEKVVEFKQQAKLEAKRKKALNEKLNFIVDQTEKYSQQVAEGMNKAAPGASKATSLNSSRKSSPIPSSTRLGSDDEWSRPNEDSDDDEETIAQAEAEIPASSTNDEIDRLQQESEMDLDDFLMTLPKDYLVNRDKIVVPEDSSGESGSEEQDVEFEASGESDDDEDTIMEQEKAEKNPNHQEEIDELNAENEMSIDELMAKYKRAAPENVKMDSDDEDDDDAGSMQEELDSDDDDDDESDEAMDVDSEPESSEKSAQGSSSKEAGDDVGLKNLLEDQKNNDSSCDNGDAILNDVAAIAQSIQPKGNTLSSTSVVTPIPFLLKHTLREYQHIGLDWLVTMHDRKLNGILADEMGLGKTIQTIALLAHLACIRANWGPHLIVVPSSVMLNWEMEFKKWCPGFKIMTYYGSQKERKLKRVGWTKVNAFHVCITSYKLVIQDHQSFRRKKWKYLILDEAQNIKNFRSQRWQLLLNFSTEQRLLLTGTPLQNNMMELWSLMHFLMPNFFESHRAFEELFSKPMTGMVEGNVAYNETIIIKLHKVLRPFLLRRLKSEVEKQMPQKYEHVVMCRLSKRQRYLYDDFMSRAKTKETLASGNLLSVINVLMQLRKVCNHPNLFEVRPTVSPFRMDQIEMKVPSMIYNIVQYDPLRDIDLVALNMVLIHLETCLSAFVAYRMKQLITPKKLIEEIDNAPELPPICPPNKCRIHLRIKPHIQRDIVTSLEPHIKVGTSPALRADGTRFISIHDKKNAMIIDEDKSQVATLQSLPSTSGTFSLRHASGQIFLVNNKQNILTKSGVMVVNQQQNAGPSISQPLAHAVIEAVKSNPIVATSAPIVLDEKPTANEFHLADMEELKQEYRHHILQLLSKSNRRKCDAAPMYGGDVREAVHRLLTISSNLEKHPFVVQSHFNCSQTQVKGSDWSLATTIKSIEQRAEELKEVFEKFTFVVPAVSASQPVLSVTHMHPSQRSEEVFRERVICHEMAPRTALLHPIASAMTTQFPDPRLIQYDCGKLQALTLLLRELKSGSHRVLIFTQMTRMLDVLEAFLNYHGHIYLRLDGTTKVEQRQLLMERFNEDKRIFVFILSTRSGGVGINLTGADTVIFYDSDWNPTCDAQAQDRCHRIGQTRDVHIYRLISEKTIEENILKKANQKRLLGDLAIEGGNFTEAYFKNSTIQDLFNVDTSEDASARLADVVDRDKERREKLTHSLATTSTATVPQSVGQDSDKSVVGAFESALAAAEDDQDVEAAKEAKAEAAEDLAEFDENIPITDDRDPEQTKQEKEVQNLIEQLSPIERYALKFVEETGANWAAIQIKAVEMEIEQQKREWEEKRLVQQQQEEQEKQRAEKEDNELLTYSREDALNKIWISSNTMEEMPMWCPPTPPQDGNDIYIDHSLTFLYDTRNVMDDNQLPAVYMKKEYKRVHTDDGFYMDGRRPLKIRKDDGYIPPRSLFDRPSPALAKMRKDLKQQRNRGIIRSIPMVAVKQQQIPPKPLIEPEGMAEWLIFEDRAILNVIQNLQGLPLNLMLISPGHTPNWDLVADIVNQSSRTYRSPKQCRWRYEAVIVPREEGKLIDSPKKQKKNKNPLKTSMKASRTPRTAQLYQNDNNNSFIKLTKMKVDAIKSAMTKKQPQMKKYSLNNTVLNQKHLGVLNEMGIVNYDIPPSPIEIAHKCHERLIQDRNIAQQKIEQQVKMQTKPPPSVGTTQIMPDQLSPMQIQQQSSPQPHMTSLQQATIVVQQPGNVSNQQQQGQQQSITALVHGSQLQAQRIQAQTINLTPTNQQSQIMKAIVSSPAGAGQQALLTGIIQQMNNPQSIQNSQANLIQTSSVSVVLTSPPATVTSVQPQIVSIQPSVATSQSPIMTSIVQTLNQQGQGQVPQVVSVGQLVGTGLTPGIVSNPQIRQRLVSTKEVLFQNRLSNQNQPTVISLSGQSITQLPATLRFTSNFSQPNLKAAGSGDKVIPGAKLMTGTPQFHIYGQQQVRHKLRFLQTGIPAGTAQTTLVPSSGTVGQTVQVQAGQKVTVATFTPAGLAQSQGQSISGQQTDGIDVQSQVPSGSVTVQVGTGLQQRAQIIKQVTAKQAMGQGPGNQKLLMLKHEALPNYQKSQVQLSPQTQLAYALGTPQVQQIGTSVGQQITTLIKTSGSGNTTVAGSVPTAGTAHVGMKLSPVRAGLQNQTVRQLAIPQMTVVNQAPRKGAPKVTQITQMPSKGSLVLHQKDGEGKVMIQELRPGGLIKTSSGIFLSQPNVGNVIPVSVSQSNTRGEALQFVTPTVSRGIQGAGNIRLQGTQTIKMISGNDTSIALSQVIAQRRVQTVSVQKPQQQSVQQMSTSSSSSSSVDASGAGPSQSSANPAQTVTQPQQSPQQK